MYSIQNLWGSGFEAVAAKLWNCLSLSLHCTDSSDTVKMPLNTFLHRKSLIFLFLFYVFILLFYIVMICCIYISGFVVKRFVIFSVKSAK